MALGLLRREGEKLFANGQASVLYFDAIYLTSIGMQILFQKLREKEIYSTVYATSSSSCSGHPKR